MFRTSSGETGVTSVKKSSTTSSGSDITLPYMSLFGSLIPIEFPVDFDIR